MLAGRKTKASGILPPCVRMYTNPAKTSNFRPNSYDLWTDSSPLTQPKKILRRPKILDRLRSRHICILSAFLYDCLVSCFWKTASQKLRYAGIIYGLVSTPLAREYRNIFVNLSRKFLWFGLCANIFSSDNVLRCGLTSKHTQPDLLRTHICYEPTHVHIGEPVVINEYEVYWRSPVRDFILGEITLACSQSYTTHCRDTDIFFAYRGKGTVTQLQANAQSPSLSFEQGSSWLGVGGQGLSLHAHQANSIFRASVNNLFTNPHC